NYNGSDSFTYKVTDRGDPDNCGVPSTSCDAAKTSTTKTVSITVNPVNDAPVANDFSLSTNEDTAASVDLSAHVSDVETSNANLTYTIVSGPTAGSLSGSGGSRTYTPNANFNGSDSFTYKVTDRGDPDNCGVPSTSCDAAKTSTTKTVSITVNPVNDQPTASASPANLTALNAINEDAAPTTVALSGSDVETAAGNLTFTITQEPTHGTLKTGTTTLHSSDTFVGSPTDVTYQPDANYNGSDSFKFKVTDTGDPAGCSGSLPACDAPLASAVQTVSITVNPVNDPPTANDFPANTNDDTAASVDLAATAVALAASNAELAA